MNFAEYQQGQQRTAADHAGRTFNEEDMRALIGSLGLVGEAGELANKVKKFSVRGGKTAALFTEIIDEAGDVLWYLSEVCSAYDIELEAVARRNKTKLELRHADRLRGVKP